MQAEPTTPSAVVKPTVESTAQPVATKQAVPIESTQFNTPLVAGMYVNTHTHHRLTIKYYSCKAIRSSAADKIMVITIVFLYSFSDTAATTGFNVHLFD